VVINNRIKGVTLMDKQYNIITTIRELFYGGSDTSSPGDDFLSITGKSLDSKLTIYGQNYNAASIPSEWRSGYDILNLYKSLNLGDKIKFNGYLQSVTDSGIYNYVVTELSRIGIDLQDTCCQLFAGALLIGLAGYLYYRSTKPKSSNSGTSTQQGSDSSQTSSSQQPSSQTSQATSTTQQGSDSSQTSSTSADKTSQSK